MTGAIVLILLQSLVHVSSISSVTMVTLIGLKVCCLVIVKQYFYKNNRQYTYMTKVNLLYNNFELATSVQWMGLMCTQN